MQAILLMYLIGWVSFTTWSFTYLHLQTKDKEMMRSWDNKGERGLVILSTIAISLIYPVWIIQSIINHIHEKRSKYGRKQ